MRIEQLCVRVTFQCDGRPDGKKCLQRDEDAVVSIAGRTIEHLSKGTRDAVAAAVQELVGKGWTETSRGCQYCERCSKDNNAKMGCDQ